MYAVGNNELEGRLEPKPGDRVLCLRCGGVHQLVCFQTPGGFLNDQYMYVDCGDESYLAVVDGKLLQGYDMLNFTQRWGRFKIDGIFIRALRAGGTDSDAYKQLIELFKEVLVLRAEHNLANDEIEYMGISPHFEPIEEGSIIPFYEVHYKKEHYTPGEGDHTPGFCPECKQPGVSPEGAGYVVYKITGFKKED